jgi:hypothetical protein
MAELQEMARVSLAACGYAAGSVCQRDLDQARTSQSR